MDTIRRTAGEIIEEMDTFMAERMKELAAEKTAEQDTDRYTIYQLRFFGEYGSVMYMGSWKETKEWLEGVVFDDPAVSDRVEKILHPERFNEKRSSVLKRLKEKRLEVHRRDDKKEPLKIKAKDVPDL